MTAIRCLFINEFINASPLFPERRDRRDAIRLFVLKCEEKRGNPNYRCSCLFLYLLNLEFCWCGNVPEKVTTMQSFGVWGCQCASPCFAKQKKIKDPFLKRVTVCTSARWAGRTWMSATLWLRCKQLCSLDWNWCTVEYLIFNLLLQQPVEQKHTGARRKQVGMTGSFLDRYPHIS